jgi:hypothetical protein
MSIKYINLSEAEESHSKFKTDSFLDRLKTVCYSIPAARRDLQPEDLSCFVNSELAPVR